MLSLPACTRLRLILARPCKPTLPTPLDQVEKAEAAREWTWNNPALLHEEFISVNERHRRESQTNPIAVF